MQERRRPERGDEEIGIAVVVVVADRGAHAVHTQANAGGFGDIREMQRAAAVGGGNEIVAEEATGRRSASPASRLRRGVERQGRALHEEDVEIAVVVVIEERDAGAHDLRQKVVAAGAVDVRKRQTGCCGRFDEDRR